MPSPTPDLPPVLTFLRQTLDATGLALEFHPVAHPDASPRPNTQQPDLLHLEFTGPDLPLLLERRGELLNALEHIVAQLLRLPPDQHHRIRLDAAGFKADRDRELQESIVEAIAEVITTGRPVRFAPMNSRERRLLHLQAAAAGLHSASTGEGPVRSVTLSATAGASVPDPTPASGGNPDARTAKLRQSFRRR